MKTILSKGSNPFEENILMFYTLIDNRVRKVLYFIFISLTIDLITICNVKGCVPAETSLNLQFGLCRAMELEVRPKR